MSRAEAVEGTAGWVEITLLVFAGLFLVVALVGMAAF